MSPDVDAEYTEAIETGRAVKLQHENVEFANSLQVIW